MDHRSRCRAGDWRTLCAVLGASLCVAGLASADASAPSREDGLCDEVAAIVSGPPAPELFDEADARAGAATWCERYDAAGRVIREGPYRDRYPSGAPRTRAHFVDDRLEGDVLILHENGRVWMHAQYHAGQRHGAYVLFSPSGAPWLEAEYANGLAEGRQTTYFEEGGRAAESHWLHGVENGLARAWYPDGQLRLEIEIVEDVWNGRFATWHPNGQPAREGRYVPCAAHAAAAAPAATAPSCQHIGAAQDGLWQSWYPSGAPRSRQVFGRGEPLGVTLAWNQGGQPVGADQLEPLDTRAMQPAAPVR